MFHTQPSRARLSVPLPLLLLLSLSFITRPALADCECGYLSSIGINGTAGTQIGQALFTDLLETDFTRLGGGSGSGSGDGAAEWVPQAFNLTRDRARGEYGEMFAVAGVRYAKGDAGGGGVGGGGGGGGGGDQQQQDGEKGVLELVVRSQIVDGMVPVAELDTRRLDVGWGTFRASMKVSQVPGTCAAFFWYFNDTQEIDMEFLSKDFNASNGSYPVNLVLQSREAALAGYNAAKSGNFIRADLPFDPTGDFHEYRIDYLPGRVFFYADGEALAEMTGSAVPSSLGHLILQHWSNGNKYWSGGPPSEDATLEVRYVKAYFNSSVAQGQQGWESRCRDPTAANAVCVIPDVTRSNSSAAGWFFTDHGNMTVNQTTSEESAASRLARAGWLSTWSTLGLLWVIMGGLAVAS